MLLTLQHELVCCGGGRGRHLGAHSARRARAEIACQCVDARVCVRERRSSSRLHDDTTLLLLLLLSRRISDLPRLTVVAWRGSLTSATEMTKRLRLLMIHIDMRRVNAALWLRIGIDLFCQRVALLLLLLLLQLQLLLLIELYHRTHRVVVDVYDARAQVLYESVEISARGTHESMMVMMMVLIMIVVLLIMMLMLLVRLMILFVALVVFV